MHLYVGHMMGLWLAAAVAAGAGWALWLARRRSWRWRWACVILPLLAGVMAALALAELTVGWNPRAERVVVLLDLSPSTRGSAWQDPEWVRHQVQGHVAPGMRVTVVGFADSPQVLLEDAAADRATGWPVEWPAVAGNRTSVRQALAWRSSDEARGGPVAPRWLLTDGLADAAGTEPPPFAWAVTEIGPRAVDVGIAEMRLKGEGAAAELWVRVRATGAAAREVVLSQDDEAAARVPVRFAGAGERWVSVRLGELSKDRAVRLGAKLVAERAAERDPWPENDAGSLLYVAGGAPRVLVVGGQAVQWATTLREAGLRAGAIDVFEVPPDAETLVEQGWQAVLVDYAPQRGAVGGDVQGLPPAAALVLDRFVQETGGGLVIVGGRRPSLWGPWGDGARMMDKLSPLAPVPPERPGAHVIFLLDCSASMNEAVGGGVSDRKIAVAGRGLEAALEDLQTRDRVSVVTFNSQSELIADGTRDEVTRALAARIGKLQPQGTTTPDTALEIVASLVPAAPQPDAMTMVVLLTDGEIPKMDVAAWGALLKKSGTLLTVVAPAPGTGEGGNASGTDVLPALAKATGATWLALNDAGSWMGSLRRAVEERLAGKPRETSLTWELVEKQEASSKKQEVTGATTRWVESWLKPEAILLARGMPGDWALAATGRRGLGKVGAVAMDGAPELVTRLVKEVAAPPGDRRFTLTAQREGADWRVRADGHDEHGFLDGMTLRIRILFRGTTREESLPQVAPGTYEARIRGIDGPWAGVVVGAAGKEESVVGTLRPADVQTEEYPASVEHSGLPQGATRIGADDALMWRPLVTGWTIELARALWLAAAALAVAALWVRRGH